MLALGHALNRPQHIVGMSVVPDYNKLCRFNVVALVDPKLLQNSGKKRPRDNAPAGPVKLARDEPQTTADATDAAAGDAATATTDGAVAAVADAPTTMSTSAEINASPA